MTEQHEDLSPNYVRACVAQSVKAVDKAERTITHLISTPAVDRMGDVVEPAGADLGNFLKNPVALVDHDYRTEKIIGKAVSLEITEDGLVATTKFRDTPLAKDAFALASEGIGGWSIGFRPIDYEPMKDAEGRTRGFRFKKWELLEYSAVAIPANPEIVNAAVSKGLVSPENVRSFFVVEEAPKTEPVEIKTDPPTEATPEVKQTPAAQGPTAAQKVELHPVLAQALKLSVSATAKHLAYQNLADEIRKVRSTLDGKH